MSILKRGNGDGFWIAYADQLMLIVIILFAVMTINNPAKEKLKLQEEFATELRTVIGQERLDRWDAQIINDGTMRFNRPDNQFDTNASTIKPQFKRDLDEFVPLYLRVMNMPKFKTKIKEIHIDGHSSRFWNTQTSEKEAYFNNLLLSQARTVKTLEYVSENRAIAVDRDWYLKHIVSNGYGSSRPKVKNPDSVENQRVEFKVIFDGLQTGAKEAGSKNYNVTIEEK